MLKKYKIQIKSKLDLTFDGKVIITASSSIAAYRFVRRIFSDKYLIAGCMVIGQ